MPGEILAPSRLPRRGFEALHAALGATAPNHARSHLWLNRVIEPGLDFLGGARMGHQRALIIGTYGPADPLIAGRRGSPASRQLPMPWIFETGSPWNTWDRGGCRPQFARKQLERYLSRDAAFISTVSRPLAKHFAALVPGVPVHLLPNGFDPDLANRRDELMLAGREWLAINAPTGVRVFGHFGRVGASDPSSTPVLASLVREIRKRPEVAAGWHFLFVGELREDERSMIAAMPVSHSHVPTVSRERAFGLTASVDRLLLLTGSRRSVATGKLFDYIAARRPIVNITGVRNEASRIIDAYRLGSAITQSTLSATLGCLFADSLGPTEVDSEVYQKFSREHQSASLARWIAQAAR